MKPQLVDRSNNINKTFSEKINSYPYFFKVWHFHPEIELIFVRKSTGTFLIGDEMERFKPGDLFIVGSNVPHIMLNDDQYLDESLGLTAEALVIHFNKELLDNNLFDLPEANKLKSFFRDAHRAIKFSNQTALLVKDVLEDMFEMTEYEKLLTILKMFQILANDKNDYKIIGSLVFSNHYAQEANHRMDKVYDYIYCNFKQDISSSKLASIANMNNSAFCRYFKKMNKKTVSRFVNELKIGYACKLLQENELSVSEICYDSGFNNLSNFNRQFRNIKNTSPSEYAKRYS